MEADFSWEIDTYAERVLRRATEYGKPGSESHLRAIARESLIAAGLDIVDTA